MRFMSRRRSGSAEGVSSAACLRAARERSRDALRRAVRPRAADVEGLEDRRLLSADLQVNMTPIAVSNAPAPLLTPTAAVAGLDVAYDIQVINNGPDPAIDVLLTDIVPAFNTFVSFQQTSGPNFVIAPNAARPLPPIGQAGTIEAGRASFGPNETATFRVTLHVGSNTPDDKQVFNTVTVDSATDDDAPANNLFTVTREVDIQTDVSIVSNPDKINHAIEGTFFPYTVAVYNRGPSDAQTVNFTWTTPDFDPPDLEIFTELGVYYDMIGPPTGPGIGPVLVSGPAFTIQPPPPAPPAPPRGTYSGSLPTLPAGVGTTYQFFVGTPENQDIVQKSTIATASPDVNMGNNQYTDRHHVYDAPLIVDTVPNLEGNATQQIDVEVMTFRDTNAWPGNNVTQDFRTPYGRFVESYDFNGTVEWGDGTTSTTADVEVATGRNGEYRVIAHHTYAAQGAYAVTVRVTGDGENVALGNSVALIGAPPRGGASVGGLKFLENASETKQVGVFGRGTAGAGVTFTATIAWGDGTPNSAGTLVSVGGGTFEVRGTHKYADQGTYVGSVSVVGSDGVTSTFPLNVLVEDRAVDIQPVNVNAQMGIEATGVVVATFTDPGGTEAVGTYFAEIDWGDNLGVSAGVISVNAATGVFTVRGTHTYPDAGVYPMRVRVSHTTAPVAEANPTATVSVGPVRPQVEATPVNFDAVENRPLTNVLVATFTDPAGPDIPGNYTATIEWGVISGFTSQATITFVNGRFEVRSNPNETFTYIGTGAATLTVTINHGNSVDEVVNPIATIIKANSVGTINPAAITGTEGLNLAGVVVARFTSPSQTALAGNYAASINWGDGTPPSVGTVVRVAPGQFEVRGSHLYRDDGSYQTRVTVTPQGQTPVVGGPGTATIRDALLTGISRLFSATRNAAFTGVVGYVKDANVYDVNPAEYRVTINWGDGTAATAGTLQYDTVNKRWNIRGTHTYTRASPTGGFKLTITVVDGASQARITSTATVR